MAEYKYFYPEYCNYTTSSWIGHLIFAGILMREFKPGIFVELGTHLGNSYFSFCKSVKENHLKTRCWAVDSWQGENQAGNYTEDIYRFVSEYNQAHYSNFSTLLRGFFDDFTDTFKDESIDLLHIDGFHSYEAVKHDFERWYSKVRPGGIILLHDVAERKEGFGVWKFWEEISGKTAEHFHFSHSSGLGVWRKPGGKPLQSPILREFFAKDSELMDFISNVSWRKPEDMPIFPAPQENIELFYSRTPGGFQDSAKYERILVAHQCGGTPRIEFPLTPESGSFFRLDLGRKAFSYRIRKFCAVCGSHTVADFMNDASGLKFFNLFSETASDQNGIRELSVIPYTNDPQIWFSLPPGTKGSLILEFKVEPIDFTETIARKIAFLINQKEASADIQVHLSKENSDLKSIRAELQKENSDLKSIRAELQKENSDLKSIRTELQKENSDLKSIRSELQKENSDLIQNREKILENYRELSSDLKKVQEKSDQTEQEYRAEYKKLLEEKLAVEQKAMVIRKDSELLRPLYNDLMRICNERDSLAQSRIEQIRRRESQEKACMTRNSRKIYRSYRQKIFELSRNAALAEFETRKNLAENAVRTWISNMKLIRWERVLFRIAEKIKRVRQLYECHLIRISPFFDEEWYKAHHPDVTADPVQHYLNEGWRLRFDPSPIFSTAYYLDSYPEVNINPLVHFLKYGFCHGFKISPPPPILPELPEETDRELLENSPLFDADWYLAENKDVAESGMDPLTHYLESGYREGRIPSPAFRTEEYQAANPDIPREWNALVHYIRHGCYENRLCSAPIPQNTPVKYLLAKDSGLFDEKWYLEHNRDLAGAEIDLLEHYMQYGWKENREPSGKFSGRAYLDFNPDLRFAGVQPLCHFLCSGIVEGRQHETLVSEMEECQTLNQLDIVPKLYDRSISQEKLIRKNPKIGIHLHFYYTDMADYFVQYLKQIPGRFDLFLSIPQGKESDAITEYFRKALPNLNKIETVQTPNRGRDIAPLIVTFGKKLMEYDFVCHIHTKRSPHAQEQLDGWLDYIMEHLFGSAEQIRFIFSLLTRNDRIVFPPAYPKLDYDASGWGRNHDMLYACMKKYPALKLKSLPEYIEFSKGSMFWARGKAMEGFLDLPLTYEDFPQEPINSDSTLAHVLERLTLLLTAPDGNPADMLFLKDELNDYVRYQIMREKMERYSVLFAQDKALSKKMILVSHDSNKSGAPALALSIAKTLKSLGYDLYILILKKGELFPEFEKYGAVQMILPENVKQISSMLSVLKKAGFQQAILNTLLSGSLSAMFRDAGITPITLVHEMGYSIETYHWEDHASLTIGGSEKIIVPSAVVAQSWEKIGLKIPEEKLIVNPQGDYWQKIKKVFRDKKEAHREICRELHIPETSKIVLTAAILEKRKGVDAFIDTAEEFLSADPDVRFVWVGAEQDKMAEYPGLPTRTAKLKNCLFTGFIKDLDKYIAGADIFFLPSLADPFPAVSLIAASQATPIVLCDGCTGSADFCKDFSAGMIHEYSAKNFAEEIRSLLDQPELHGKVSREILNFSENFHSFRQYIIELLSYFPDGLKKVSCIVPNYQYEKYLPERLDSILKQDYPIYDIVFLDDCSSDNSLEIAGKILSEGDIDYKIMPNRQNSGCVFKQWFKGIESAKGDFVWIAEADDACSPEFLQKTMPAFHDPKVNLSYTQSCLTDSSGKVFNENFKTHTDSISAVKWLHHYVSPLNFEINDGLAVKNTIPNASAIVIRKSAVKQIDRELLFKYKVAGDWIFYLEILKGGRAAFTPDVLNYYRRHNASVVNTNVLSNYREIEMIHRHILEHFEINDMTIRNMENEFFKNYNAVRPDFTPTLDYRKYLRSRKQDMLLLLILDNLKTSKFMDEQFLRNLDKYDITLIYTGRNNPPAELLEKFPSKIGFIRLQDSFNLFFPRKERIAAIAELSRKTMLPEIEHLKLFLKPGDILMVQDPNAYFESYSGAAYEKTTLIESLQQVLSGKMPSRDKTEMLYFRGKKPSGKNVSEGFPAHNMENGR